MGLQVSATHPTRPLPTGMFSEERARKSSPLTNSGNRRPFLQTKIAMESYGISLRNRMDRTERVSTRLREFPKSWLSSNKVWASCRADAIDERKSLSLAPAAGSEL